MSSVQTNTAVLGSAHRTTSFFPGTTEKPYPVPAHEKFRTTAPLPEVD
jgi:hypothetical protein